MADNTTAPIIPLNLPSVEELNRRCSDYSRGVEARKLDDAPQDGTQYGRQDGEWVPIGDSFQDFYDQVADQIATGGGPLTSAAGFNPGDYYILTTTGAFATSLPNLAGETGVEGDRIVSNGTVWVLVTASSSYLSALVDDTAAGVITLSAGANSGVAPTAAADLTRKDYVDQGDVVDRNYADSQDAAHVGAADPHGDRAYSDTQLTNHVAAPDPHVQYTLETQALAAFVGIGYGGMFSNAQRAAPNLGGGWQIIEFDTLSVAVPAGVTLDLVNNQFSIDREGVFVLFLGFTFEHNSSNSGRLTNVRLFNVTDNTEINRIILATGRNAEASSFQQQVLVEIGPVSVSDQLRFEIGNGDTYSSVQWDQTNMSAYSVGEWRGVL